MDPTAVASWPYLSIPLYQASFEFREAVGKVTGFDGLAGKVGQITQGASLLDGVGPNLGTERFDLFLEQIDNVLGCLQPSRWRSFVITYDSSESIDQDFHTADVVFDHGSFLS